MLYFSICKTDKSLPKMATSTDIKEWLKVCMDKPLHKKFNMIKCYETASDSPHELMLMFSSYDPDAPQMLSRDFGKDWEIKTYPLHEIPHYKDEDHSIIGG